MASSENPYAKFAQEELILRDQLAIDRTVLANERTLLAYIRTALAFLVVGGTFVKFLVAPPLRIIGYVFIAIGVLLCLLGAKRFYTIDKRISSVNTVSERKS
jgi:putative membrane protein